MSFSYQRNLELIKSELEKARKWSFMKSFNKYVNTPAKVGHVPMWIRQMVRPFL